MCKQIWNSGCLRLRCLCVPDWQSEQTASVEGGDHLMNLQNTAFMFCYVFNIITIVGYINNNEDVSIRKLLKDQSTHTKLLEKRSRRGVKSPAVT